MGKTGQIDARKGHIPSTTGGQEVVLLLAMRVAVLTIALVGQSLLAYALLPEGRGAYALCVLVGSLAGVVMTVGADRGAQYFAMTGSTSVSQGIAVGLTVCAFGSLAVAALLIPMIQSELPFFQKSSARSFYLALALSPLICFSSVIRLQLAGFRRFLYLAVLSSVQAAMNVLMILVLVGWLALGVDGAIAALGCGHAMVICAGLAHIRRHYRLRLEIPQLNSIRRILGYGLREHAGQVIRAVDSRIGAMLLGIIAGRSEIGLFAAGTALMSRIGVIPDAVSISLLPRIARHSDGRVELTAFCARVCWWLTAAVFLVWISLSTPFTRILLSDSFLPVVPLTWIIGLGFVVYSGADIFMAYFRGVNRPGVCSLAMWLGLCATVVSFFPLYAAFGLAGTAWAMTIGLVCRSAHLLWMFRRVSRMRFRSILLPCYGDVAYLREAVWSIFGYTKGIPNAHS